LVARYYGHRDSSYRKLSAVTNPSLPPSSEADKMAQIAHSDPAPKPHLRMAEREEARPELN
jgi:hypothetical protein